MFQSATKSVFVTSLVLFSFLAVEIEAQGPKTTGSLYQCAHGLRGKVTVLNDRQIHIQGFNYDGKGPAAWFHGQLQGWKSIQTTDPESYVTLPYPNESCDRLKPGREYKDENVTLTLPRSVKDFATIGVLCYEFCHNFGHIEIPSDLSVPAAPGNLVPVDECPKPNYPACSSGKTKNGDLKPDCTAGASQNMMMPGNSLAARLTFISGWFILSLVLAFGNH